MLPGENMRLPEWHILFAYVTLLPIVPQRIPLCNEVGVEIVDGFGENAVLIRGFSNVGVGKL